eukprot:UN15097
MNQSYNSNFRNNRIVIFALCAHESIVDVCKII